MPISTKLPADKKKHDRRVSHSETGLYSGTLELPSWLSCILSVEYLFGEKSAERLNNSARGHRAIREYWRHGYEIVMIFGLPQR